MPHHRHDHLLVQPFDVHGVIAHNDVGQVFYGGLHHAWPTRAFTNSVYARVGVDLHEAPVAASPSGHQERFDFCDLHGYSILVQPFPFRPVKRDADTSDRKGIPELNASNRYDTRYNAGTD